MLLSYYQKSRTCVMMDTKIFGKKLVLERMSYFNQLVLKLMVTVLNQTERLVICANEVVRVKSENSDY